MFGILNFFVYYDRKYVTIWSCTIPPKTPGNITINIYNITVLNKKKIIWNIGLWFIDILTVDSKNFNRWKASSIWTGPITMITGVWKWRYFNVNFIYSFFYHIWCTWKHCARASRICITIDVNYFCKVCYYASHVAWFIFHCRKAWL